MWKNWLKKSHFTKTSFSYLVWNLKPNLKASQLHFSVKYKKKLVLVQEKFYKFIFELFTELLVGGKLIGATVALDNEGSKENLLDLDLDTLRSMEVSVFNNFRIRFILFWKLSLADWTEEASTTIITKLRRRSMI